MRYNIYSIYDTKAEIFQRPLFIQADGEAIRMFTDVIGDAEHPLGKHPEDYALFRIGIYEDANASLDGETPVQIITGLEAYANGRKIQMKKEEL